jgi:hypothetical protein
MFNDLAVFKTEEIHDCPTAVARFADQMTVQDHDNAFRDDPFWFHAKFWKGLRKPFHSRDKRFGAICCAGIVLPIVWSKSLRIRQHLGLPRGYPYSFELLAPVNEKEGRYEEAVQLLAAAETLRIRIGAPLEHVAQKHVTAVLASARNHLGDVAYELAWSKGATLTTEQALALG